ncbi:MAG: sensor histidine kinase [Aquabacterium sp.]|jgi:two-component system sensor histidine kinase AlgZ|nr:MAG: sensor histidine kinase [Aquabacterium sp.]
MRTRPPGESGHGSGHGDSTTFGNTELGPSLDGELETAPLTLDVCHVGVVLRAVLLVQVAVGIGVSFVSSGLQSAVLNLASSMAVSLPAVLLWLFLACAGKKLLARWSVGLQWTAACALGALCAWLAGLPLRGVEDLGFAWVHGLPLPLAGAAGAAAVFHWLRSRQRMQVPAAATARLVELQSRIRPHFLFNTLNTAIALVRVDPARAEAVLEDLAELFRVALEGEQAGATLAQEVELARRYLDIEQIRFGQRLRIEWDLDPACSPAKLPPLLLQPLVENAVKHGIEPGANGGTLRVRTRAHRGMAHVEVINTLPDSPSAPGHGIALRNVRERLSLMHDVAAHFEAGTKDGEYRVRIAVPLS